MLNHQKSMNRQGRLLEVSALLLILVTSLFVLKIFSEAEHIYVGDKSTKLFYDYKVCPETVNKIAQENTIIFDTVEDARKLFKEAGGCVEDE